MWKKLHTLRDWERLKQLGEGGQSQVFLVRHSDRSEKRARMLGEIRHANPWGPYDDLKNRDEVEKSAAARLASSIWEYARPESSSDLGALKLFKIPDDRRGAAEAIGRLSNEITVLRRNIAGLVPLIEANEKERWIVTEFMPSGSLDKRPALYARNAIGALKAFRSLVSTVAELHENKWVHRDIKPANVFPTGDGRLILGDFGIVFMPEQRERLTLTKQRVGPRDYMPQWGDLGERLEKVQPNFDVYMLGKLLWCMVTGRLKLPREYHKRPAYDVKALFPDDPNMHIIDTIVGKCVVEEPEHCLASAIDLLEIVTAYLAMLGRGGQLLGDGVPRPCHICGRGQYKKAELDPGVVGEAFVNLSFAGKPIKTSLLICDQCGHVELFRVL